MPAKVQFTKETIIDAAFNIASEKGLDHITIRSVATKIKASIAPIYVNFDSVDALKKAVLDKAQSIYQAMVKAENHDDLFLRYALASIKFSRQYPLIYNAFLLTEDDPLDSELNIKRMLDTIKDIPPYNTLDETVLMRFIMSMQAMQVGLSIMARKSFYAPFLTDDALIKLLDDTGNAFLSSLLLNKENPHD